MIKTLSRVLDILMCKIGKCRKCAFVRTNRGIGGKCITCGKIHGFMTDAELKEALWERVIR